ncbi:MAG: hypothetical protein QM489_01345 [Candidatus Izemoplasma sp.]
MNNSKLVYIGKIIALVLFVLIGIIVSSQIGMVLYFIIAVIGVFYIYRSVT